MIREKIEPVIWTACTTFEHPSSVSSEIVADHIYEQIGEHRSFIRAYEDYVNAFFDIAAFTHGQAEEQTRRIVDHITGGEIGGIAIRGLFVAQRDMLSNYFRPMVNEMSIHRLRKHRQQYPRFLPPVIEYPEPATILDLGARRRTTA